MRNNQIILMAVFLMVIQFNFAQTKDEIISNYIENTGGLEAWNKLEGLKMTAKASQGGMEIPVDIYTFRDGRQMTVISFQGKEIKQQVYDGKHLWSHNFMTMEAEESDAEAKSNFILSLNDFPNPFIDYASKGYTVELLGKESFEGTETFKIKLIQEPISIDGKEEESVSYYFFDTENFVPIAMQAEVKAGPGKGMVAETTFSDYQEVEGLYFPFSMTQGVKGKPGDPVTMTSIELNPKVASKEFALPKEK